MSDKIEEWLSKESIKQKVDEGFCWVLGVGKTKKICLVTYSIYDNKYNLVYDHVTLDYIESVEILIDWCAILGIKLINE